MPSALPDPVLTPWRHALRPLWTLQPDMHFLNHGSFGAAPKSVLRAQRRWQARLERQPVHFMRSVLPEALQRVRARLAAWLGTQPERLGLVDNATTGVNAVLRSIPWRSGDRIVMLDDAYLAVRHSVDHLARQHDLRVTRVPLTLPLRDVEDVADALLDACAPDTRLLIVDHIVSTLAVVLPLSNLIARAHQRGIAILVDGAHAPGMLPLQLDALGADWYCGNAHKWMLAPKGCAFVVAHPKQAATLHPAVISNFYGQGLAAEFDWQGTRDPSAWLALDAALDFLDALPPARYREALRHQAHDSAQLLMQRWQVQALAPLGAFAAMVTLPMPVGESGEAAARQWQQRLWRQHRIEVPVLALRDRLWVRVSAQIYNDLSDVEALAQALRP